MITLKVAPEVWKAARSHLDRQAEEVGFFLADWSAKKNTFHVRSWRPMNCETSGGPDDLHVSLSDASRAEIIKWAWEEDACLIEAHSHGRWSPAAFSRFDLRGFEDWVPHLWWRLGGRPYAAVVTSISDFDALAWTRDPHKPEQVVGVSAEAWITASRATLGLEIGDARG
jgi:hypothetical protein